MCNITLCRCSRHRSWTQCAFPQLQTGKYFNSRSRKWAIPNLWHQYIAIIQPPLASRITPSRDKNACAQWKWDSFGLQMQWIRENSTSKTTQGRKTLWTTRVSTTLVLTMWQSVLGTYTNLLLSVISQELESKTLPDGYLRTNPLPQVPTRQSVPTSKICLPPYFGLPIGIQGIHSLHMSSIPTIARAQIPWWYISLNLTTFFY